VTVGFRLGLGRLRVDVPDAGASARFPQVEGLRRKEKEEFYERVSEQMTPELRARLLKIAHTFERLDG